MDRRIQLYRQVVGWFAHYDITQPKDVPVTTEEDVKVETPDYVKKADTNLPYHLGNRVNIYV